MATSDDMTSKKRVIVISIDESDESQWALEWAIENIIKENDKLHILHAQPPVRMYGGPVGPAHYMSAAPMYVPQEYFDSIRKHAETKSKALLKAAKDKAIAHGVRHVEGDIIEGEPREAICAAVEQLHADLLVMGSHGFGAVKRAFLGSVSDYCVHHAICPVTIVRRSAAAVTDRQHKQ